LSKPSLHILPTLDDLVADHSKVNDLSGDECQTMLIKLATAQTLLLGRLLSFKGNPELVEEDKLLTAGQAAKQLGCTPDWLYRHSKELPFTRRLSSRQLRFSSKGITQYIRNRAN